jgi:hypothetical protein
MARVTGGKAVTRHDEIENTIVVEVAPDWIAARLLGFHDEANLARDVDELLGQQFR